MKKFTIGLFIGVVSFGIVSAGYGQGSVKNPQVIFDQKVDKNVSNLNTEMGEIYNLLKITDARNTALENRVTKLEQQVAFLANRQ